MSEDKVEYSQKLMEFAAEAQEELRGEGLEQINTGGGMRGCFLAAVSGDGTES